MGLADTLHYYWTEMADPRTNDWIFVGSPFTVPFLIFSYLYFVLICGPKFMKDRRPYSLMTFARYYNVFQILYNIWLNYRFAEDGCMKDIWIYCEPVDYSTSPRLMRLAATFWWGLVLKLIDFIETGIFVLRKKNNQINFLHLYHHVSTVIIIWLSTKYIPGCMPAYICIVNNSVHVFMYTYYFLSTFGSEVRKLITPLKPMITIIQMLQFVILMVYCLQALRPSCPVPKFPAPLMVTNLLINFFLFYDFYRKSYRKPSKKQN